MKFKINVEGKAYEVEAEERGGRLEIKIDGRPIDVSIEEVSGREAAVAPAGTAGTTAPAVPAKPLAPAAHAAPAITHAGPGKPVICPMAGVVLAVKVKPGDRVSRGDSLFVLEAMKMENDILAEMDGTIGVVKVTEGSRAMQGDVLCTIV